MSRRGLFTSRLSGIGAQRERAQGEPAQREPRRYRGLIAAVGLVGAAILAALVVALLIGRAGSTPGQVAGTVADDSFERTETAAWGSASVGGTYSLFGTATDYGVAGGSGRMVIATAGASRGAILTGVSVRDVDVRIRLATDRSVTGSGQFGYIVLRHVSAEEEYRGKVRIASDGGIHLQVTRVEGGTEVSLGPEVRQAVTLKPDEYLWMRAHISGANPTSISLRAWAGQALEPTSWATSVFDSAPLLQVAGAIGIRAYVSRSATNVPVTFSFDDFVASPPATTGAPASPGSDGDPRIFAAGDIASCSVATDEDTAWLLDGVEGLIMPLGDLAYESGTKEEFDTCYEPNWGRHKGRTRPVPGNHEYRTPGAAGYFDYFGSLAGDRSQGYYSFDLGAWHIVVLNSNCDDVGCESGSPQEQWLRADLLNADHECTLVAMHEPRFSSGEHGSIGRLTSLWVAMYEAGVDVVLSGHDHGYERFLPQDPYGNQDPAFGIPQFVVGTGGRSLRGFDGPPLPGTAIRDRSSYGVVEVALRAGRFDWRFLSTGGPLADSGSSTCHGAPSEQGLTAASDPFDRVVVDNWASAPQGGAWTLYSSARDYDVSGSVGTMLLGEPGTTRYAYLGAVSLLDVELTARFSRDRRSTGSSSHFVYLVGRRQSDGGEYRAKARLAADGAVYIQVTRVVDGTETGLGAEIPVVGVVPRMAGTSGCGSRSGALDPRRFARAGLGRWSCRAGHLARDRDGLHAGPSGARLGRGQQLLG